MMNKSFLAFFHLILCSALIILPSALDAQDTPQDFLDAHNAARAEVNVGPLTWDSELEAYAKEYANSRITDCKLKHSDGPYGENLVWSTDEMSAKDAVKEWVDEKAYYTYSTNSCQQYKVCGHYTQVVWKNSVRLGCAKVKCDNDKGTIITCNYDPRGNNEDEKPYGYLYAVA